MKTPEEIADECLGVPTIDWSKTNEEPVLEDLRERIAAAIRDSVIAKLEDVKRIVLADPNDCPHCGIGDRPDYRMRMLAEEIDKKILKCLQFTRGELKQMNRDNPPPPELFENP